MPSANGHGPNKTMERVALYLRVSSEEQKTKETIATQDAFLSEYCNLYHHEIVGAYKDAAISGTVPMAERLAGRSFAGQEVPESSAPRHDLGRLPRRFFLPLSYRAGGLFGKHVSCA